MSRTAMSIFDEDSDSSIEGYDPKTGRWTTASDVGSWKTANKEKRNKKRVKNEAEMVCKNDKEIGQANEGSHTDTGTGDNICGGRTKNGACKKIVAPEERSIGCGICQRRFHVECTGISADGVQAMVDHDLSWMCRDCRDSIPEFRQLIVDRQSSRHDYKLLSKMSDKLDELQDAVKSLAANKSLEQKLDQKIASIEKSVNEITQQQSRVEKTIGEHKDSVGTMPKFSEEIRQSAGEIKKLLQSTEKASRHHNIILHNIPECESQDPAERRMYDTDSFYNVATSLLGSADDIEVVEIFRLGKKTPQSEGCTAKPRLIKARLRCVGHVDSMIRKRTNLKNVGFPNIYLTKDLSPEERATEKRLREEVIKKGKDSYTIFRGQIVPRC